MTNTFTKRLKYDLSNKFVERVGSIESNFNRTLVKQLELQSVEPYNSRLNRRPLQKPGYCNLVIEYFVVEIVAWPNKTVTFQNRATRHDSKKDEFRYRVVFLRWF